MSASSLISLGIVLIVIFMFFILPEILKPKKISPYQNIKAQKLIPCWKCGVKLVLRDHEAGIEWAHPNNGCVHAGVELCHPDDFEAWNKKTPPEGGA